MAVRARKNTDDAARARMLAGVPVAELWLDVAGASTSVLEAGSGPPIVLLHGGIECGGAYWAPVISQLAETHRVVVPDLPGLGESEPIPTLDEAAFGDWLASLLQLTCDEPPLLVDHSLLGSFAARFARQNADLLRRLVIYGAPGIGPYRMPLGLRLAAIRFSLRPSERSLERFERFALFDLDMTRRRDPQWFRAFSTYTLSRARIPHVKRAMRQLISVGTKQIPDCSLQRIVVPTTLVWGRHDRMAPLTLAERASTRFEWPLHVIDDAGHVPHMEQPAGFLRALRLGL